MSGEVDALFTYRPSPGCSRLYCHPPPRPWSRAWSGRVPRTCWSLGPGCCPQTGGPDSSVHWSSSCRGKHNCECWKTLLNNVEVLSMKHKWLIARTRPGIHTGEREGKDQAARSNNSDWWVNMLAFVHLCTYAYISLSQYIIIIWHFNMELLWHHIINSCPGTDLLFLHKCFVNSCTLKMTDILQMLMHLIQ